MQLPDNVASVLSVDFLLHESDRSLCYRTTCGYKNDAWLLREVSRWSEGGFMTLEEGQNFVSGRTV